VCHEQDLVFILIKNEGGKTMTSVVVIVLDFNREISLLMLSCAVHLFFLIPRSEKFLVVHSSWPDYSGEFSFWPRPSLVFFCMGKSCSPARLFLLVPSRVCLPGQNFHFVFPVCAECALVFSLTGPSPG
jgi:hypothetical protein